MNITRKVSKSGNPKRISGTETSGLAACPLSRKSEMIPTQASTTPIVRLPESPRKIRAGEWLCGRNPRQAPASDTVSSATTTLPVSALMTAKAIAMQTVTPETRPSMPSSRLMALVTPTIQISVTGRPNQPRWMRPPRGFWNVSIRYPPIQRPMAIVDWAKNFFVASAPLMSS